MRYKLIIFDMDGTFIDSRAFHAQIFYRFFKKYQQPFGYEQCYQAVGKTVRQIFDEAGISSMEQDIYFRRLDSFYRRDGAELLPSVKLADGFLDFMGFIKEKGVKTAVVTNSLREVVEHVVTDYRLEEFFDNISGADAQSLQKDERCADIVKRERVKPKDVLVIGDTEGDMTLACRMGFDSCFARTDIGWYEDGENIERTQKPTMIFHTYQELIQTFMKEEEKMADFNMEQTGFDFVRGFTMDFDKVTGLSKKKSTSKRYLSQMKGMFADDAAYEKKLKEEGDILVYEFHELGVPEQEGDLAFGCSITYPGKVGDEYYMTKGHFHTILDTAEVYYCMSGHGYMLIENPEGDWAAHELQQGKAVYVPKRYAHRSINVDAKEPLVTFFVFRADAGHDYGTIETKGYRKLIVEKNQVVTVVDNPKWR